MTEPLVVSKTHLVFRAHGQSLLPVVERLQLTNCDSFHRVFKVMGTNIQAYILKPIQGCIAPKSSLMISIEAIVSADDKPINRNDRFAVCSVPVNQNVTDASHIKQLLLSHAQNQDIAIITAFYEYRPAPMIPVLEITEQTPKFDPKSFQSMSSILPMNFGTSPIGASKRLSHFTFYRDQALLQHQESLIKLNEESKLMPKAKELSKEEAHEVISHLQQNRFMLENQLKSVRVF